MGLVASFSCVIDSLIVYFQFVFFCCMVRYTPASQPQANNQLRLGCDGNANLLGVDKLLLEVGINLPNNDFLELT